MFLVRFSLPFGLSADDSNISLIHDLIYNFTVKSFIQYGNIAIIWWIEMA